MIHFFTFLNQITDLKKEVKFIYFLIDFSFLLFEKCLTFCYLLDVSEIEAETFDDKSNVKIRLFYVSCTFKHIYYC